MINFARFDTDGRYTMSGVVTEDGLAFEDTTRIYIGDVDITKHYHDLVTGEPVPFPEKTSPLDNRFDYTTKSWVQDTSLILLEITGQRTRMLSESDWVVSRAMEQGTPVPLEWVAYRQALRDIPKQLGYPTKINWPIAPSN